MKEEIEFDYDDGYDDSAMQVIQFEDLADRLASRTSPKALTTARGKDFIIELGEQTGIGSSSLLVRKCGKTILIDRGIAFEGYGTTKVTTLPVGENLDKVHVDAMIFTHVHADHAGLIVPTVLAHPEARVFLSQKTLEELKIVLADTLSVQKKYPKWPTILDRKPQLPCSTNRTWQHF